MNEFDNNKSIETLLEKTAEQVQPNPVFKAGLEDRLRKAHKPRTKFLLPHIGNLSSALAGIAVLGALVIFMLWTFQSVKPQNNFGNSEDFTCPVTPPNGSLPPGETVNSPDYLGNGELWTALWPDGKVIMESHNVEADGSYSMKWGFIRGVTGPLIVEGHRLDADAEPLRADIPEGYGDSGFQVTGLFFPTTGCWEVTARVGDSSLTFVTEVIYKEDTTTATPAAGVIIDPNATPAAESIGGYDFRGGKLFLSQPLPDSPQNANVYNLIQDQPATLEQALELANRFALQGEVYTTTFPQDPERNGYVISDGRQMLTVYTANYFTFTPDILGHYRNFNGTPNENAETIIDAYLKEYGFDFSFEISESGLYGGYLIQPLSPDGRPMQYDYFALPASRVTLGGNGEVKYFEGNLLNYDPKPVGSYGIISAEEALNALLDNSSTIGVIEAGHSSGGEPPQQWFHDYPDNQTVTISGGLSFYPPFKPGQGALYLIDGITVTGNISGLEKLNPYAFVQATGQFVVENGVRKFNIESLATDAIQVNVAGSLRREGDQIILASDDGVNEYVLIDPPADLPLNTEPGKSYLGISGVMQNTGLNWSSITYAEDARSMGGGGGGGGMGFHQLNLSGTPIAFPTPVPSEEQYTPSELAGFMKYTVQQGDTLESISTAFGVPVEDIVRANYLTSPELGAGWTITIPSVPGPTRLVDEQGLVQIYNFVKPDGRQRTEYHFLSGKNGTYYELRGDNLEPLKEFVNRPVTISGSISVDDAGNLFLDVEKYQPLYPGLQFQILKGTQKSTEINGTPVLLFTTNGTTYVVLSSTGLYPDLNYDMGFPEEINLEALIIPGETYGGYPALRVFNSAPAVNPITNEPIELIPMADRLEPMPDPYGNADKYVQPDMIIDTVELVYYVMDPKAQPLNESLQPFPDNSYIQPAWHFHGRYSNNQEVDILVQALKLEFLMPETLPYQQGG